MKSIKAKILTAMILTIAISLSLVGGISCILGYNGTQSTLQAGMQVSAVLAADRVAYELDVYKTVVSEVGGVSRLSDPEATLAEKKEVLQQRADLYNFSRYNLLDTRGASLLDGSSYSDREYFRQAMQGMVYVSEPLVSAVTGEMTVIVAGPVWANGDVGTQVVGVVYFVPHEGFLNEIAQSLHVSDDGAAYMLDANGTTIAHKNPENVRNQENTIQDAQNDASLADLAAIESQMISGATGWSIAINAPTSDFTRSAILAVVATIVILVASTVIACLLALRLALGIGKPVKACADRLRLLAQGDLDTPVPEFHRNDEIGELVESTQVIVTGLSTVLSDIDHMLSNMGNGNFVVDSQAPEVYIGNFEPLLVSLRKLKTKLSDVLLQIQTSAEQIAAGAEQVSDGAQALAQGSTEQASSVEELAASVNEAAKATKDLIENSIQAVQRGNVIVNDVMDSLQKTTDLAMQAVSDMGEVAVAVSEEVEAISQVTIGLDQISSVVQTNSATSEDSAAASEELSSQAQILKDLVAQFHLPQDGYDYSPQKYQ